MGRKGLFCRKKSRGGTSVSFVLGVGPFASPGRGKKAGKICPPVKRKKDFTFPEGMIASGRGEGKYSLEAEKSKEKEESAHCRKEEGAEK